MKLAAIDIGTNSTRLLIADIFRDFNERLRLAAVQRRMQITRLGKNLEKTKVISEESAENTLKVLKTYHTLIKKHNVTGYRAVGTEVLRKAHNSKWFKDEVKSKAGLELEVIDWEEEAGLSFTGAVKENKVLDYITVKGSNILVIDIGGGSTEFIIGNINGDILYADSADIGCVKLTEEFIRSDIPEKSELRELRVFIKEKAEAIFKKIKGIFKNDTFCMIGLAGTITTLASIDLELEDYDRERIHGHILKIQNILGIYNRFINLNLKERKKITGLESKRADIITAGTMVLIEIMNMADVHELFVSESDILDGIIYSIF
ncbi:MAG: hypothetical protein FJW61_01840 [Actinobacteria bacterium]|nr:hypothetical protein [Actinomycetota bacterium]MBM3709150.1 hypothetical protein [Actinomycetota bacterium]